MNSWIPAMQAWLGPENADVVAFVTDWAGPLGWWIVLQLAFVLGGWQRGVQISVLAGFAMFTNTWLKWLIAEPRPFISDAEIHAFRGTEGFGMPSGHAQGAVAVWGWLAWVFRTRPILVVVFLLLLFATGSSRVYMGVHSPAQVLIGWTVGFAFLAATIAIWPALTRWFSSRSPIQIWGLLAVSVVALIGVTELVLAVSQPVDVPQAWLENQARASGEEVVTAASLGLFRNIIPLFALLTAGYIACGILCWQFDLDLSSVKAKVVAVVLSVVANLLYLDVLGAAQEAEIALLLAAFGQPLVGVLLPLWVCSRFVETP